MDTQSLFSSAQDILRSHAVSCEYGVRYTACSLHTQALQTSWESACASLGLSTIDPQRAEEELESLFRSQWSNGMVPHMVFHNDEHLDQHIRNQEIALWQSELSDAAPQNIRTSGIAHLPLHAFAIWRIYAHKREHDGQRKAFSFLRQWYPLLQQWHRYLHTHRDPQQSGLITIYHPWESGMENSPRWDSVLSHVYAKDISSYERWDLHGVNPVERPSDDEYGIYLQLVESLRYHQYDDTLIQQQHPFLVQDIALSSMLYRADTYLLQMAIALEENTEEIEEWLDRYETGVIEHAWNSDDKRFYDVDLRTLQHIPVVTMASLMPLLCVRLPQDIRTQLIQQSISSDFCSGGSAALALSPSVSPHDVHFVHNVSWRGPVWIWTNWLLSHALYDQGEMRLADYLVERICTLVEAQGFAEYFSPETGEALGTQNHATTAALLLEILVRQEQKNTLPLSC